MKFKKFAILLAAAVIVIFLAFTACRIFYPKYNITKGSVSSPSRPDYTGQYISVWHNPGYVPKNSKRAQNADEIQRWIFAVSDELAAYTSPYNITVSGEVSGGKTTLRYEGIATTAEGETVNYFNEKTFDFVLDKKPFSQNSVAVSTPYATLAVNVAVFAAVGALLIILFVKRRSVIAVS